LAATATTVSSSANPSTSGQQVTITAVVTATGSQGTPTGNVTFTIDGQAQTPVPLSVVGGVDEAQFPTSTLTARAHTVSASYSGDSVFATSSGSLPTQTVDSAALPATMTTVNSSSNPSTVGEQVTFTAVVIATGSQGTPTGDVTFTIDGQAQSAVALSVVGGVDQAQVVTSTLTAGRHSVAAAYSGSSSFGSSGVQNPLYQVVNARATTTTLISSENPSTVGDRVTFTATVAPNSGGDAPQGTVTITIDGKAETSVPLQLVGGKDQASVSISTLSAGKHTVSAFYSGDPTFAASALAGPLTQTVNGPAQGTAPTVVLLQRFGIHMQPTSVVFSFSGALDLNTAQDVHNYRIVGPSGRHIVIDTAVYDPTTKSVTLHPSERINLHHNYRLTVYGNGPGSVASVSHALLDGAGDGSPGSDYVATLNWKNVVLTTSELLTLHAQSHARPGGALAHRFVSRNR
jgi:Bacterial Ig-like domain (group 3)